mgnify:CR=1 FL=1
MALLQCNFFSQALMRTVPIQVVLPRTSAEWVSTGGSFRHSRKWF